LALSKCDSKIKDNDQFKVNFSMHYECLERLSSGNVTSIVLGLIRPIDINLKAADMWESQLFRSLPMQHCTATSSGRRVYAMRFLPLSHSLYWW